MAHFTSEFHTFFAGLEAHNDRDWYADHKKDYERHVRDPFKAFITAVIEACAKRDSKYAEVEAKQCIFRIHRDTRFSKDKTPPRPTPPPTLPQAARSRETWTVHPCGCPYPAHRGGAYWSTRTTSTCCANDGSNPQTND